MKSIVTFIVLINSLFIYSQKDLIKRDLLTYGYLIPGKNHYSNFLFSKYNFKSKSVAGCLVSRKLLDSVNNNNRLLWKEIDSVYGVNTSKNIKNFRRLLTKFLIGNSSKIEKRKKIRRIYRIYQKEGNYGDMKLQEITLDKIIYRIEGIQKKKTTKKTHQFIKHLTTLKLMNLKLLNYNFFSLDYT